MFVHLETRKKVSILWISHPIVSMVVGHRFKKREIGIDINTYIWKRLKLSIILYNLYIDIQGLF